MEPLREHSLNKLDNDEIAERDREWTRTPRCGSGAVVPSDSVEPPPMLASRTCATIWAIMDNEKQEDYTPNSGTFLDSAFFSPETVLPASYLLRASEPEEIKYETPRAARRIAITEEPSRRSSHWVGLVASVSVGMVIAFLLFPMVALVTRSTQSYMTESWENEIQRRVGNYEQIHANQGNTLLNEELLPYNLAASSWQELHSEIFWHRHNVLSREGRKSWLPDPDPPTIEEVFAAITVQLPPLSHVLLSESPLPLYSEASSPVAADMSTMADSMLLVTPGQNHSVRSAFGQNILLRDGRVFFRILPGAESPKR